MSATYIAVLILSFVTGDNHTVQYSASSEEVANDMCEHARDYIAARGGDARNVIHEQGQSVYAMAAGRVVGAFCIPAGLRSDWGDRPRKLPECLSGFGGITGIPQFCTPEERRKYEEQFLREHPNRPPGPEAK